MTSSLLLISGAASGLVLAGTFGYQVSKWIRQPDSRGLAPVLASSLAFKLGVAASVTLFLGQIQVTPKSLFQDLGTLVGLQTTGLLALGYLAGTLVGVSLGATVGFIESKRSTAPLD